MKRRDFLAAAGIATAAPAVAAAARSGLAVAFDEGGLARLRLAGDPDATDYLAPDARLGAVDVALRVAGGAWTSPAARDVRVDRAGPRRWRRRATLDPGGGAAVAIASAFAVTGDGLDWTIALANRGAVPVEIGTLALPLAMNGQFSAKHPLSSFVLKNSFVSGAGSFLYWSRTRADAALLVMTPGRGTAPEYWDAADGRPYRVFVHSAAEREAVAAAGGTWRLPATSAVLAPGAVRRYAFRFRQVADRAGVRDALVAAGLPDIEIAPGMTIPAGWDATVAIRARDRVTAIDAEHPGATRIDALPPRAGRQRFRVRFDRLGENRLAVVQPGGRITHLEFFVTEPIATMIAKRGAFIARHQHRDPSKWYHGLLAEWNAESRTMLGPDDYDRIRGWRIYETTCDDPGLSKPAFLAAKNAVYPVQAEVDALDLYVDRFVWGRLQRTTAETRPYGLYGIPDWRTNRQSADAGSKGRLHIWRPYDYPHIALMYLSLWRTARDHRHIRTRLPADTYLDRAAETAIAMFEIPAAVIGWSGYETGFYNECVYPELIDALVAAGRDGQAQRLRHHWERKVDFFVRGRPDLFGSEYAFDSTGFESTQAIAAYAIAHAGGTGPLRVTAAQAQAFSERQIAANLFCRGAIEPAYYLLGSDYRGQGGDAYTLSYMAQMGGWALLDHALAQPRTPHALLRLAYQSYLSSWALVNSGTAASGHGYWFPGAANDGAAGGGFEPAAHGRTWLDQPHHRGAWYYSCEIDLGFCGALRAAATVLVDDPVFGRLCLGGEWREADGALHVTPQDGVRRRLHLRLDDRRLDLRLRNDRFADGHAVAIGRDGTIAFAIETDDPGAHAAAIDIAGLAPGRYALAAGDAAPVAAGGPARFALRPIG